MAETVTARDANHHFARLLREVEAGKEFVVTRNGVPVARIVPEPPARPGRRRLTPEKALEESMAMLRRGWPPGIGRLDREELYDRPTVAKDREPVATAAEPGCEAVISGGCGTAATAHGAALEGVRVVGAFNGTTVSAEARRRLGLG